MSGTPSKWDDVNYHRAFMMARSGMADQTIAQALGVSHMTFMRWKEQRPALVAALQEGRAAGDPDNGGTFQDYVYTRLPEELQDTWRQIMEWEDWGAGPEYVANLLKDKGKVARQRLFIHALVHCNFNVSAAMAKINVSRKTYENWVQDPEFATLMEEIEWHKCNFFEEALMDLVRAREPAAVMFVNRTKNANRGYTDKGLTVTHQHNHTGIVAHVVEAVPVDSLGMNFDEKLALLNRIRAAKATNNPQALPAPQQAPIPTTATPSPPAAAPVPAAWDS